jgi:sulfotransferase
MEHNLVDSRANNLFSDNGLVGSCLKAINNIGDVPDIMPHLFIWRYEDFVENPDHATRILFNFLGVDEVEINFNNIIQSTYESDSHYNMKYSHKIKSRISETKEAPVSPRIVKEIENRFKWYYNTYYKDNMQQVVNTETNLEDEIFIRQLEEKISKEIGK